MAHLSISPDIEKDPWSDSGINRDNLGVVERIGRLPRGMDSGESSVTIMVRLPDRSVAFGEVSFKQLTIAMRAMQAAEEEGARGKN